MDEITVENLSFKYGSRTALDKVSFRVASRHIHGLLGPNGSGKTTLFRILCTLLRPDTGRVLVAGLSVTEDPYAVRQRIGVVFQNNSLDRELTVAENMSCQGQMHGLSNTAIRARVGELLEQFGLAARAGERAGALSGGLLRRMEIAKSLIHRPSLLILDEPSAALDPSARYDLWRYLTNLREQSSMTILLTTHLMEEADRCDQLTILNHGRIVSEGAPETLKQGIGGDVVSVRAEQPVDLCARIEQEFGYTAQLLDGVIRIELPRGHEFVARIIEAFPGRVSAVTVSRPTLEDVFVHQTGRRFADDVLAGSE